MTSIRTKTKNHRHSSRDCWNPVTRDGKYTISISPALTFHEFWISAIPAKMTSSYTNTTIPVIPAGNVESSDQGWEAHNIYIPNTHLPWILDLGNLCQDDELLYNHHNTRHSSRERWNPVTRDGKYTISIFPAPTLHGF